MGAKETLYISTSSSTSLSTSSSTPSNIVSGKSKKNRKNTKTGKSGKTSNSGSKAVVIVLLSFAVFTALNNVYIQRQLDEWTFDQVNDHEDSSSSPFIYENDHHDDTSSLPINSSNGMKRSELIQIENNDAFHSDKKIFSHFFVHIPKTGAEYALQKLLELTIFTNHKYHKLNMPNRQRPCNEAKRLIRNFHPVFHTTYKGVQCNMWMSERKIEITPHKKLYNHAYVIIRKPSEHVVSQYFHCKESNDHSYAAEHMPSLDKWLDFHIERMDNATKTGETLITQKEHYFGCYDPNNHQSFFTQFDVDVTEDVLKDRFDLVGDMSHISKSICAIHIRYTGFVPPMCDCSLGSDGEGRRRLHDHGVQHHGATFELTEEQEAKIAKLTQNDRLLYDIAQRVFADQVREIEEELDIRLCENPDMSEILDEKWKEDDDENDDIDGASASAKDNNALNLTKSELIRIENNNTFHSDKKIFSHFFVHIPKTGGEYALQKLLELTKFTNHEHQKLNMPNRQRPCNMGVKLLRNFDRVFFAKYRGDQCNMWMSERPVVLSSLKP